MTLLGLAVAGRGPVDPDEPVLHADDEALLRGRAAFETLRVYAGRPFRLGLHLERLSASAERIGLAPVDGAQYARLAEQALTQAAVTEAVLRLYWTAGQEGESRPLALALVSPVPAHLEPLRSRGLRLVALPLGVEPNLRSVAPWLLGGVKSTSYAVNMAAQAEAERRGADDAVFLATGAVVLEGPVTNIWWRTGNTLFTPGVELGVLAGVTRATLLELAPALGYEIQEGCFHRDELAGAEEAFSSSSVREIMPVVALDGLPIGDGRPGPSADKLQRALRDAAAHPERWDAH